jgi:hypothetical protein
MTPLPAFRRMSASVADEPRTEIVRAFRKPRKQRGRQLRRPQRGRNQRTASLLMQRSCHSTVHWRVLTVRRIGLRINSTNQLFGITYLCDSAHAGWLGLLTDFAGQEPGDGKASIPSRPSEHGRSTWGRAGRAISRQLLNCVAVADCRWWREGYVSSSASLGLSSSRSC